MSSKKPKGSLLGTCRVCGEKVYPGEGQIMIDTPTIAAYHRGACQEALDRGWREMLDRLPWLLEMAR